MDSNYSNVSEEDLNRVVIMHDERWYDRSSAAYFTSKATRNAQTVSFRQRHRPIFQLYLDIQVFILCGFSLLIMTVLQFRQDHTGISVGDMLLGNVSVLAGSVFFFVKFCAFALWYRCTSLGNVLERTNCVFWLR